MNPELRSKIFNDQLVQASYLMNFYVQTVLCSTTIRTLAAVYKLYVEIFNKNNY